MVTMSEATSWRAAVVGLGTAGSTLHLPALAGMPNVEIVGACDLDAGRRETVAAQFKVPVFGDFDDMLERARPNVVVIGTPPATHAEYCLRSIAAGADVICEKPFVSSVEQANEVIAAARAAGKHI